MPKSKSKYDSNWWFGENSFWGRGSSALSGVNLPDQGGISFMGFDFDWGEGSNNDRGKDEKPNYMQYAFLALGAYVVIKVVGK